MILISVLTLLYLQLSKYIKYNNINEKKKNLFLLCFCIILIDAVNALTLNALGFSFLEDSQFYTNVVKNFNTYAEKNNLDINIKFNLVANTNSTGSVDDFLSLLESIHYKHSTKT